MSKGKILFQLSGSIACFKACQLLSRLVKAGYEVETVATKSALAFVGEATLEGLTGRPAHVETFATGGYMDHIRLARWADLILLCPATANTINKLASGIGDDLVSTLFLAHDFKKPYLIAPAMNEKMLLHPATRSAMAMLRSWGVTVLESGDGSLACGESGEGRLLEPDDLYLRIEKQLASSSHVGGPRLRALVTAGGTREPIDGVRALTNFSSGQTGIGIAEQLVRDGHDVTLLCARSAGRASNGMKSIEFETFSDLREQLRVELGSKDFDVVIHAAAVGDYSLSGIEVDGRKHSGTGKIDSGNDLVLRLKRNPKLVDELRSLSRNPRVRIVAFKLTNTAGIDERQEAIRKLIQHAKPDFIVHNDLSEISASAHKAKIFAITEPGEPTEVASTESKPQLASTLERILTQERGGRGHALES